MLSKLSLDINSSSQIDGKLPTEKGFICRCRETISRFIANELPGFDIATKVML